MKRTTIAAALILAGCATAATQTTATESAAEKSETDAMKHHGPHIVETVSNNDFAMTLEKLQTAIDSRNFKTFAVVDHAKGAASIDQDLRPTTLVIFGNPRGGTPLMLSAQTLGIELPLKALVYEKADGSVVIATTDIAHALKEHGVTDKDELKGRITGALQAISNDAAN
ncbi:MAG: DUF302 domain-containing protein [Pseudomonadota bacterium]